MAEASLTEAAAIHPRSKSLLHPHASDFEGTALVALERVQITVGAFRLDADQDHFAATAFGANHQRFDARLFGALFHLLTMRQILRIG